MMKKWTATLLACLAAAQMHAAEWLTDVPKALEIARAENKLVLLDFTGSDWCPYCQALQAKVLASKKFEAYADRNLVLVKVDFPRTTKQPMELKEANSELAGKFKVDTFPTVILLGPKGKELKRVVGYGGKPPEKYIARLAVKEQ
jgi:thioredoxin-related protein